MKPTSRGYLTMAAGPPHFLEMAVDMALSLREWTELPVALATDRGLESRARELGSGVFSHVIPMEDRFLQGRARKYGVARASPFCEAVFIDADCLILDSPDFIFERAGSGPLTMIGERLTAADRAYHHGFSTPKLMERLGVEAYFKNHSGVFHFRREGAVPLLDECLEAYRSQILPLRSRLRPWELLGDELAFGLVGARRQVQGFQGAAPVLWPHQMAELDLDAPISSPVLHFIGPIPRRAMDRLMVGVRRRRREADLPSEDSVVLWEREERRSRWGWRMGRLIRRMLR